MGRWYGSFCGSKGATPGNLVLATRLEATARNAEEIRKNWRQRNPSGIEEEYREWRFGKSNKSTIFELRSGN